LEPRPSPPGSEAQEVGYREPGAIVHRGGGIDDCGLELGVHLRKPRLDQRRELGAQVLGVERRRNVGFGPALRHRAAQHVGGSRHRAYQPSQTHRVSRGQAQITVILALAR
jgi:hypothetical protein